MNKGQVKNPKKPYILPPPIEEDDNPDGYFNSLGKFVFSASYHKKRGYCCKNRCLNCPFGQKKEL